MAGAIVGLAEAIEALRAELTEAMNEGRAEDMQFSLEPVELTVQAVITKEGSGKLGWKVLEFGGSYEAATTQALKLRLTPLWKTKDGTLVRDFTIASVSDVGDLIGPHEQ
jgi:Trypsin-co-occurring domain 2